VKEMQSVFSKNGESTSSQTQKGYYFDELLSALQKDIRRGNEYEAVYWGVELDSFNPKALWNRLRIIASEDIGIANPNATLIIDVLEKQYDDFKERDKDDYRLFLIHAILYLARSPKSRLVDNLLITVYHDKRKLEMPDDAIDKHTIRGRKMGRGYKHFFEVGSLITNKAFEDIYESKAREILDKKKANL
jgi:replication-associated recombination protein RarA